MSALIATATAVGIPLGYFAVCAIWPWTKCAKCEGGGRKMSPSGKHWRDCRRCGGTGKRVRRGRRVWRYLRRQATGRQ